VGVAETAAAQPGNSRAGHADRRRERGRLVGEGQIAGAGGADKAAHHCGEGGALVADGFLVDRAERAGNAGLRAPAKSSLFRQTVPKAAGGRISAR
jgi:hypothetical protein